MKDYIVKTTEVSARFWGCLFIWLYESTGAVDDLPRSRNAKKRKISHQQGKKVSSEWRLFSKMNFYLLFFMLSNRIQNYLCK